MLFAENDQVLERQVLAPEDAQARRTRIRLDGAAVDADAFVGG